MKSYWFSLNLLLLFFIVLSIQYLFMLFLHFSFLLTIQLLFVIIYIIYIYIIYIYSIHTFMLDGRWAFWLGNEYPPSSIAEYQNNKNIEISNTPKISISFCYATRQVGFLIKSSVKSTIINHTNNSTFDWGFHVHNCFWYINYLFSVQLV